MQRLALAVALALTACGHSATGNDQSAGDASAAPETLPVAMTAADGVTVYGRYRAAASPRAMILLFHQAGSSKDEYTAIGDRLQKARYSSLAIDQRSGGDLFGPNETVKALGHEGSYLDAKKDLEAALAWAGDKHLPVILWGSSYSASLVFLVAAEHPQVRAVLAFSPGEYLGGDHMVGDAAAKVNVPVFVTSAQDPKEIEAARTILAAAPARDKQQFVPTEGGVHGSSTLIAARNPGGNAAAWAAVLAFLDRVTR